MVGLDVNLGGFECRGAHIKAGNVTNWHERASIWHQTVLGELYQIYTFWILVAQNYTNKLESARLPSSYGLYRTEHFALGIFPAHIKDEMLWSRPLKKELEWLLVDIKKRNRNLGTTFILIVLILPKREMGRLFQLLGLIWSLSTTLRYFFIHWGKIIRNIDTKVMKTGRGKKKR